MLPSGLSVALETNVAYNSFYEYAKACCSKCGPWISIPDITWEAAHNAELQAPDQIPVQTPLICTLMRPRTLCVHVHLGSIPKNHPPSGPVPENSLEFYFSLP